MLSFSRPRDRKAERRFWASVAAEGRAALVASHLMSQLQETAGHLVIAGRGKIIADISVADLVASASGRVTVRTSARQDATAVLSDAGATVADAAYRIRCRARPAPGRLIGWRR
jgi:ABC-2 type transport system ATP-binding protein